MSKDAKFILTILVLAILSLFCIVSFNKNYPNQPVFNQLENIGIGDVNGFSNYDGK